MDWLDATARNSNLLPVNAKGDVRFLSEMSRGSSGRAVTPRRSTSSAPRVAGGRPSMIERTISVLNERFGLTILLIEQNVEFARKASHHMVILEKGEVVANMPASEMTEEITSKYVAI